MSWDDLPADFVVALVPGIPLTADALRHPFATESGVALFQSVLMAGAIWRKLTKAQRELLLSSVAGYPILPRADVKARMVARGLIADDLTATEAGRVLVRLRPA